MTTLQTLRSQHGDGLRDVLMGMQPSRMDALVAAEIFGWTDIHISNVRGAGELEGQQFPMQFGTAPHASKIDLVREYSSTWEGAGAVVERMREMGYEFEIMSQPGRKTYCRFWKGEYESGPLIECTAIRETLCRAVAECSLLAVAGEQR